jgi:Fe-S-cluster containining protein
MTPSVETKAKHMLIAHGRCAALTLDRETSRFLCAIYERRPSICRDLVRSSPACLFEHATKAIRVAAALHEAHVAVAPELPGK